MRALLGRSCALVTRGPRAAWVPAAPGEPHLGGSLVGLSRLWRWRGPSGLRWVWRNGRFSFSITPSNEHPGLISFRMDWLDLLAVQGTLKSLLSQDYVPGSHGDKMPLAKLASQTDKSFHS